MSCQRHYSRLDQFLCEAGNLLATTSSWQAKAKTPDTTRRANPAAEISENSLGEHEKKLSAALMRVNHAGEVAAQGLYLGQSLSAKSSATKQQMRDAAAEEGDHLDWCAQRLNELGSHTSYLNPLWHTGSIMIGVITGQTGDRLSYGFVEETEQQVMKHLQKHLAELPTQDQKSRHSRVEIFIAADQAEAIATAIMNAAHIGVEGDGIVAISPVQALYRIRTQSKLGKL